MLKPLHTFLTSLLGISISANFAYMFYRFLKATVINKQSISKASELQAVKANDKLVVLGCGASINELEDDFFQCLDGYDVAAFSYAALLPVDITYYLYEIPEGRLFNEHREHLYPVVESKCMSGAIKSMMLKNPHAVAPAFHSRFPKVRSTLTLPIHLKKTSALKRMLLIIMRLGWQASYFFQARASLFSTCFWADATGYKEIYLVGIDLNHSQYFFEQQNKWIAENISNPFDEEADTNLHPTNDESKGMKVEDAMSVLGSVIGASVFVQSPDSALAKWFPVKRRPD